MVEKLKYEWLNQPGKNILAGIVVALALIPEAIAFSIIAGVDPMVGLYASFIIAVVTAVVGGRAAMISGATGAVALLVVPLVKDHGVEYLLAATILMGIIQLILGLLKVGRLMKFIPHSVMIGFVNALGIMIFMSQIEHIFGISISTYIYVIVTLLIVYIIPKFFKAIPAPLIAIIVLTALYMYTGSDVRTVGDLGDFKQSLPHFLIPNVPFNFETLQIIFPYSLSMAIVGLVESLLTAKIVDDATDTYSSKNRESRGQGIANIITGLFGGMGGCAMIGQSVINVKSGANSRLSTFTAGIVLIFMIIVLGGIVVQIPMPILAGIMVMVSVGTFDWTSFKYIQKAPKTDAVVMVLTVIIVLMTHNLAIGVVVGVVFSALFFATKISKVEVTSEEFGKVNRMSFKGQIFFVSIDSMMEQINFNIENSKIELNFNDAHLWDDSAVDAIDTIVRKFEEKNNIVHVEKLNSDSRKIVSELSKLNENHLN
ncbi:SulP family inorganic anion transporter [Staphylococcus epidermidis]|uniref:SulP family inorganic anion transporter n=1 Tax=Staphylococcus epidermidis TaxID=1282 RepID=UPI001FFCD4A6|nr:SulP family inorganic anion transporter [Staphylococcus epidermidis]MCG1161904.1 SulP family inorganic anion transporter [Staphylococcus epidermidis]MCG1438477.1 SulP family inorganic anion transporter [Staphylococcus epidermidis]MCG1752328.1 SulP family inorganic anion transporter [Staphylococcus epidermidis]MCG1837291.1 SulP family inorganic anion transporter [Staphylococcus epidermidis]MCG1846105.1 SulP family inorganic anion transporter [Staphylococcus epidermidis]